MKNIKNYKYIAVGTFVLYALLMIVNPLIVAWMSTLLVGLNAIATPFSARSMEKKQAEMNAKMLEHMNTYMQQMQNAQKTSV